MRMVRPVAPRFVLPLTRQPNEYPLGLFAQLPGLHTSFLPARFTLGLAITAGFATAGVEETGAGAGATGPGEGDGDGPGVGPGAGAVAPCTSIIFEAVVRVAVAPSFV
jgi:hypothetical protein